MTRPRQPITTVNVGEIVTIRVTVRSRYQTDRFAGRILAVDDKAIRLDTLAHGYGWTTDLHGTTGEVVLPWARIRDITILEAAD